MKKTKEKIKILHISSFKNTTPPTKYGGTERLVHFLCNFLTTKGFNILLLRLQGSKGGEYKSINIKEASIIKIVKESIRKFNPDIIHIHLKDVNLIDFLSKQNIPVVITLYNNIRKDSKWINLIKKSNNNFFFTAISEDLKDRANHFSRTKRVTVSRPCYDITPYLKSRDLRVKGKYFLYLGVISRYKSVLDIVKVFSKLKEDLYLVGPCNSDDQESYFNEILQYIKKFDNIKYLGQTNNENEKINIIKNSKALILATGYDRKERNCHEAFGLVMLEANSLGVPIIGYNHGNISDYIIDKENGLKFKNKNELIKNIKEVSDIKYEWSSQCVKKAKSFEPKNVIFDYIRLYKKIILDNKL